jgi:death-on-curing protein
MAIEEVYYLTYPEAVALHIELMRWAGEVHFGVFRRELVQSALGRPQHAAVYEQADLIRQAASLCFGLIKDHPWLGGNKRTANFLTFVFLERNGLTVEAPIEEVVTMVLEVEADRWKVDDIEAWLCRHTQPTPEAESGGKF